MMNRNAANMPGHDKAKALATLEIDMIADLVCPWCYLGKRRLDDALLAVHGPTALTWYPFQLNPEMPESGMAFDEYLARKFGNPEALQPALDELVKAGQAEGISFRFDRVNRIPNTLSAHRLMRLAETEGANVSELAEHLLKGFFEDGLDISDRDVLVEMGGRSGLTAGVVNRTLEDAVTRQVVLSQEAQLRKGGITGVPDFLINKRLFVVGAQSTESLVAVFDRAMFGPQDEQSAPPVYH